VEGRKVEKGTLAGNSYYRVAGGGWKTREEARELEITASTIPTKNKK